MLRYRLGVMDSEMQGIKPGDTALIRAEVLAVQPGVGLLVKLFSKTDEYQARIRPDLIADVEHHGVGLDPEPADGRWVMIGPQETPLLWHRSCAKGYHDSERRFDRHWWSHVTQGWVDWPTVNAEMAGWTRHGYTWQLVEMYAVKDD